MKRSAEAGRYCRSITNRGFTALEFLVAVLLLGALVAVAVPNVAAWRQSSEVRRSAYEIMAVLREARSRAITMNREHRVEFPRGLCRYGIRTGSRANHTNWKTALPVVIWHQCRGETLLDANIESVQFNTNGTANGGTITVSGAGAHRSYAVVVNRTGRIRMK